MNPYEPYIPANIDRYYCVLNNDKAYKKKVFDWRNPTIPIYPADPTYFY